MAPPPASTASLTASQAPASAGPPPGFLRDVLDGLGRPRKAIPSRWLYDARGSQLFQRIMALEAYYPTRAEREILERHAADIASALSSGPCGDACTVVDLGAGDGAKTHLLLEALCRRGSPPTYAPVDLSADALAASSSRMTSALPGLRLAPVQADYLEGLRSLGSGGSGPRLVLFLGSNIGNLEPLAAASFLRSLRESLRPGDRLLVGLDLLKEQATLQAAYDDPGGVTAAFNLNLLSRINRELGGDFDPGTFEHLATFDAHRPAMESWLRSRLRQSVRVAGHRFRFEPGERIHTEISCKYRGSDLATLARTAGLVEVGRFHDRRRWFVDVLWRAGGP